MIHDPQRPERIDDIWAPRHGHSVRAHCHWTYEQGRYRSPWYWPTRADAEHASRAFPAPDADGEPRIFAVHAAHCTCAEKEGVPA